MKNDTIEEWLTKQDRTKISMLLLLFRQKIFSGPITQVQITESIRYTKRSLLEVHISLHFPSFQSMICFMCFFISSPIIGLNIGMAGNLKIRNNTTSKSRIKIKTRDNTKLKLAVSLSKNLERATKYSLNFHALDGHKFNFTRAQ